MIPGRTQILKATADIAKALGTDTADVERHFLQHAVVLARLRQEGKRPASKRGWQRTSAPRQRCKKNLNVKVKQHTVLLTH